MSACRTQYSASSATRHRRRGAATIETAMVLAVLLTVLFATLDLGLASFRRNSVHEAARSLARAAIVRGSKAEANGWGPVAYDGPVSDAPSYVSILRPSLATMPLENVRMQVEWPDGDCVAGSRVRVAIGYKHTPIVPFLYGGAPIEIRSTSTMRIVQ